MNKFKLALPKNMTTKARNGFNITVVLLIALVFFDVYSTINFLTLRTTTQLFAMSLSYIMSAIAFAGAWLSWHNRAETAGWLLIAGSIAALFFSNFLGAGLGVIYALTSIVVVFAIASSTFPKERIGQAMLLSVISGAAGIIVDVYFPNKAAIGAVSPTFTYVILAVLMALLIFVVSRQYSSYSLRTKLLIGGNTLILISVGTLGFINAYNSRSNLTTISGTAIKSVADAQAAAIRNVLLQKTDVLQSFALTKIVQDRVDEANASYTPDVAFNQQQIDALDQQWRAADKADNNNDPLVSGVLTSVVASELREFRDAFPENVEVFVTDKYGANVASTNRTSDYYQADEDWWQSAYNNGQGAIYIGQPEYDQSSNTFGLVLAVPLYKHGTREVTGVMRSTLDIKLILVILNTKVLNGTGLVSLYLPNGQVLEPGTSEGVRPADSQALAFLPALTSTKAYDTFTLDGIPSVVGAATVTSDDSDEKPAVENLGWTIVVSQSQADNLAPIRQQTQATIIVALIILAIGAMLTIFLAQYLSGPIIRLTTVAEQISAGNMTAQAQVETGDEIGTLAATFNSMTAQLQNTLQNLEQRVADRTRALATATEVSRRLSTILDEKQLVTEVVEQVQKAYNYYHGQIYLLDESGKTLVLAGATGEGGKALLDKKHSLSIERGLVGRSARTKSAVLVPDTSKDSEWLPNPLLPDTKAEIAIPILLGQTLLGVLDMQDDVTGDIYPEDIEYLTAISNQTAIALQNSRSLAQAQKKAERESLIASIGQKIQQEASVENAMKVAIREVGRALGTSTSVKLKPGNGKE
jgi:putative methionine-R-sulfoxide reductase with GAF domain